MKFANMLILAALLHALPYAAPAQEVASDVEYTSSGLYVDPPRFIDAEPIPLTREEETERQIYPREEDERPRLERFQDIDRRPEFAKDLSVCIIAPIAIEDYYVGCYLTFEPRPAIAVFDD